MGIAMASIAINVPSRPNASGPYRRVIMGAKAMVKDLGCYADKIGFLKNGVDIEELLLSEQLSKVQKINLLQVLHTLKSNDQR